MPLFAWLHTITSYQHKHGGRFGEVAVKLYREGGVRRFYRGLALTLVHVPLCRFGGIAATDGAFAALQGFALPAVATAAVASSGAAASRVFLMPLGALSTTQQVYGKDGIRHFVSRARAKPSSMWSGSSSAMTASWLGHWVWCSTDKLMRQRLPEFKEVPHGEHARNAVIGFSSCVASDAVTNPFRVLCTNRQTGSLRSGGASLAKLVAKEGLLNFAGRGLAGRLMMNGMQGACITVGWQAIAAWLSS